MGSAQKGVCLIDKANNLLGIGVSLLTFVGEIGDKQRIEIVMNPATV